MGPGIGTRQDAQGSSSATPNSTARRDAEAARLRQELELSNMRLSQMQTRLVATLDELDASRAAHQKEMKTEKRANEKLSEKLDRYLDEVKRAEAERDEMREVVSILVEKVERCNDYSVWPYSRMSLARPLEPAPLRHSSRRADSDRDVIHAALLEAMTRQLEEERRAHARTKEQSDAEIFRLRAMVARRDAELEACVTHAGHRVLLSSSYPVDVPPESSRPCPACVHSRRHVPEDVPIGPSRPTRGERAHEDERVLSHTLIRQRTLEREVEYLRHQLHEVTSPETASDIPAPPPQPPMNNPETNRATATRSKQAVGHVIPLSGRDTRSPPSPQLLPRAGPGSPTRFELTPGRHLHRPNTITESSPLPGPTHSAAAEIARFDSSPGLGLEDLKLQIDLLSTEIVAFGAERDALKRMLAEARPRGRDVPTAGGPELVEPVTASTPVPVPQKPDEDDLTTRVLHHEEECARETRALRRQLEELAAESARREQALQAEIDNLRQALLDPRAADGPAAREDQPRYASGDLKVPSSRAHPPNPSAPRVPAVVPTPGTNLDDAAARPRTPDALGERDEQEGARPNAETTEDGSELDEQSMELATPLHHTILSLADDDLLFPYTDHTSTSMLVEPSEVPLPISPDEFDVDVPLITFSPPPADPGYPQTSTPYRPSPPLNAEGARIPTDLLARVESMSQARVDAIEREVEERQRELDQRTRELEEKNASLARLEDQLAHGGASQTEAEDAVSKSEHMQ
ncbi:hypothetical protein L226DRAFT_265401 [Lentinus tigrinus ALCF2SS1-7]|uniref:Uncharacterized protein n=1 Tax=Lentinus tigrinus ALCF2SS1-6 TaxID=1328759 RepID=A0A5C2S5A8_9APHY|nr:hypothetical protein L227DRAFT_178298 [Lentinus tigrinus ALCF2SS1-6]RPD69828.1 hypothetical protein L226DRAFT_265401 [Lentinus tigrinus ALCF2SS1-7]